MEAETKRLLGMMSPVNLAKVESAKHLGRRVVRTLYRRTRDVQRAEIRFDGIAGCLRTPAGGSKSFTKARLRTPDNLAEFAPRRIALPPPR
jgi:hypothetical protein